MGPRTAAGQPDQQAVGDRQPGGRACARTTNMMQQRRRPGRPPPPRPSWRARPWGRACAGRSRGREVGAGVVAEGHGDGQQHPGRARAAASRCRSASGAASAADVEDAERRRRRGARRPPGSRPGRAASAPPSPSAPPASRPAPARAPGRAPRCRPTPSATIAARSSARRAGQHDGRVLVKRQPGDQQHQRAEPQRLAPEDQRATSGSATDAPTSDPQRQVRHERRAAQPALRICSRVRPNRRSRPRNDSSAW